MLLIVDVYLQLRKVYAINVCDSSSYFYTPVNMKKDGKG